MKEWKLGVHAQPYSVAFAPDYAKRLVEKAGVDHFILRVGYGPDYPAAVGKAIEVIRDLNADVFFMFGVWWGEAMKMVQDIPNKSWESKFTIEVPGSSADTYLIAKMKELCGQFKPDAICITHGRYRHPAYIDGIFDEAGGSEEYRARMKAAGIPREDVLAARADWEKALHRMNKGTLLKGTEQGLVPFLCELSQSDAAERLVAFRCQTVHDSLRAFRKTAKAFDGVTFGTNAYSPIAARICGQTYDVAYAETCEFVQPLLTYMEWHRYEPIAAWARYLQRFSGVDDASAIEASKQLFQLGGTICPDSIRELDTCGEGTDESILSLVGKDLELCAPYLSQPYPVSPVLRGGPQWKPAVIDRLMEKARGLGFRGFEFMGCDYLLPNEPSVDWF